MCDVTVDACYRGMTEDKQAMCVTMCLFYSSASEDLGCRRGDFSRKHYGSVELVSPTHTARLCLLLFFVSPRPPRDLPSPPGSHSHCLPIISVGMGGQQRGTDES